MDRLRLVPVARGLSEFEARVVTARLGADGIVWELRGSGGIYPLGDVDVLVPDAEVDDARRLLTAAPDDPDGTDEPEVLPAGRRRWALAATLVGVGAFVALRILGSLAIGDDPVRCADRAAGLTPTTRLDCRP